MFDLQTIIRENVKSLIPYSSARDEFTGEKGVFLDANENPFNEPYNRYPDPLQRKVKEKLANLKKVHPDQIFLGNGSDEAIDLLIRAFCEPHVNNIVSVHPSYGMYQVAADINAVEFTKVFLNTDFSLDLPAIFNAINNETKLIMLCSPNNPTANSLPITEVLEIVRQFEGLVVVDEAYIDFSKQESLLAYISAYSNLIVLQTFSKAWGMAALRMGIAFASADIIHILNKIKYPYNINKITQELVLRALDNESVKNKRVRKILSQRDKLIKKISGLKTVLTIYPSDANFILVKVADTQKLYNYLLNQKIIIRDRSKIQHCEGCLRITIGRKSENKILFHAWAQFDKETLTN